jgi:choloylglycine hydrolase
MKTARGLVGLVVACLGLLSVNPVAACTDFVVKAEDGAYVCGRSMEFGIELKSKLLTHPRGEVRTTSTPDGKSGIKWTSKYGYVSLDGVGLGICVDGMNEKGLSCGFLWFPGAKYQNAKAENEANVFAVDLGDWILGNFSTCEEVKAAISKVRVWCKFVPELGQEPPVHIALHDAQGHNVVIEFIDGEQKVYDNPNGVLTNAPSFDWQITNLKNYIQVSAANPQPLKVEGTVLAPPGQGSGFLGIPGDWTPSSRFIRSTAMLHFAKPASNAQEAVNLSEHILNAVDIPRGDVRPTDNGVANADYTQWAVIKDLTNQVLYFRDYGNLTLRSIDLKKESLEPGSKGKSISVVGATTK